MKKMETKDISEFMQTALVLAFEVTNYMTLYMWKQTMKLPRKKKKKKRKDILNKIDKLEESFLKSVAG